MAGVNSNGNKDYPSLFGNNTPDVDKMNYENESSDSSACSDEEIDTTYTDGQNTNWNPEDIKRMRSRTLILGIMILIVGSAASAGFLYVSVNAARSEGEADFRSEARELVEDIENSYNAYEVAALWIHEACRTRGITRKEFRDLYEYLISTGLEFQAVEFIQNITDAERHDLEVQTKKYFAMNYPDLTYNGIVGYEPTNWTNSELSIQPRSQQPFYFPVHYLEPVESNAAAIDLDLYSSSEHREVIDLALETWKPTLSGGILTTTDTEVNAYSILLMHPGITVTSEPNARAHDLSLLVIRMQDLLSRATQGHDRSLALYMYDTMAADEERNATTQFLAAVNVVGEGEHIDFDSIATVSPAIHDRKIYPDGTDRIVFVEEMEYEHLISSLGPSLLFEKDVNVASHVWKVVIFTIPSNFEPSLTFGIFGGAMILTACLCIVFWIYTNLLRMVKIDQIKTEALAESAIVSSLFPSHIRERLIKDAGQLAKSQVEKSKPAKFPSANSGIEMSNRTALSNDSSNYLGKGSIHSLPSEGIFGSKPIAELIPEVTVMFADVTNFTAWSSVRDPTQVFTLLETIYNAFDNIAKRRKVFKLETVGDCYVAVTGLPEPREDHAVIMAKFATNCLTRMKDITRALETHLGPDTADLELRIGMHSGPVTAGVLRGDNCRFQLFGDTMNTASRMESNGFRSRIHVSLETAILLQAAGKGKWLTAREDKVVAKGKGELKTFWLDIYKGKTSTGSTMSFSDTFTTKRNSDDDDLEKDAADQRHDKTERLVMWNVDVLCRLLRKVVARRNEYIKQGKAKGVPVQVDGRRELLADFRRKSDGNIVLDEVKDIITLPEFDPSFLDNQIDPDSIELDPDVVSQLTSFVRAIAYMYHCNPFHNFEHASHVTMSVTKLLGRIVNPKETQLVNSREENVAHDDLSKQRADLASNLHDHTFGITSDPLTQFACIFAALIHDVDHPGVPNSTLVEEKSTLATLYRNKSVAEQNSLDVTWDLLMGDQYEKFRNCLLCDKDELTRFRAIIVNVVMATDIIDKDLGALRKARWNKAFFSPSPTSSTLDSKELAREETNRKATIVIEHLIQASDVSHTMQHWHIFIKWNERLFHEMYRAYKQGRIDSDPSTCWYEGEKGFFDFYIIPLAKKLDTCGVFGVSSDEYLNYAVANRQEWEAKGESMVKGYMESYQSVYGGILNDESELSSLCMLPEEDDVELISIVKHLSQECIPDHDGDQLRDAVRELSRRQSLGMY